MRLAAEIIRLLLAPGGHYIPPNPPATDMVQRGKLPRHMIRLVVRRRSTRHEPQPLRHRRQRPDHRQRLKHINPRVVRKLIIIPRRMPHRDPIRPEHEMHTSPLRRLRNPLPQRKIQRRIRLRPGHPPPRGMRPIGDDVQPQLHPPCTVQPIDLLMHTQQHRHGRIRFTRKEGLLF